MKNPSTKAEPEAPAPTHVPPQHASAAQTRSHGTQWLQERSSKLRAEQQTHFSASVLWGAAVMLLQKCFVFSADRRTSKMKYFPTGEAKVQQSYKRC